MPGGTSALLYLLLPIIPAFLAYEFFDSLRAGLGVKMPAFKSDYIVPAFLASMLLSYLSLRSQSFVYADPVRFLWILLLSTVAGAAIPAVRWVVRSVRYRADSFDEAKGFHDYMEKALKQANSGKVEWLTATTADGQTVAGAVLKQPDGSEVLGGLLQVSPVEGKIDWEGLKKVVEPDGTLKDAPKLLALVGTGAVRVSFQERIELAGVRQERKILPMPNGELKDPKRELKALVRSTN